jgi:hypothetical protein
MINLHSGPEAIVVLKYVSWTNLVPIDFWHDVNLTLKVVFDLTRPISCASEHDKAWLRRVPIGEVMH